MCPGVLVLVITILQIPLESTYMCRYSISIVWKRDREDDGNNIQNEQNRNLRMIRRVREGLISVRGSARSPGCQRAAPPGCPWIVNTPIPKPQSDYTNCSETLRQQSIFIFNCESKQFNNLSDHSVCLSVCATLEILILKVHQPIRAQFETN